MSEVLDNLRRAGGAAALLLFAAVAAAQPPTAKSIAPLVDAVAPAVVNITVRGDGGRSSNPMCNHPFWGRMLRAVATRTDSVGTMGLMRISRVNSGWSDMRAPDTCCDRDRDDCFLAEIVGHNKHEGLMRASYFAPGGYLSCRARVAALECAVKPQTLRVIPCFKVASWHSSRR